MALDPKTLSQEELMLVKQYIEALLQEVGSNTGEDGSPEDEVVEVIADSSESSLFDLGDGEESGSQVKVFRSKKTIRARGTALNPMETKSGTNTLTFTVPSGYKYSHMEIVRGKLSWPIELVQDRPVPSAGTTGRVNIKTRWKLWGAGEINYDVKAYCIPADARPVAVVRYQDFSTQWKELVDKLISQKLSCDVTIGGTTGWAVWEAINSLGGAEADFSGESDLEDGGVTIALAAIAGAVVVALAAMGLYALSDMVNRATSKGCDTNAKQVTGKDGVETIISISGC